MAIRISAQVLGICKIKHVRSTRPALYTPHILRANGPLEAAGNTLYVNAMEPGIGKND